MARTDRRRSKQWRFSDSGNRFDSRRRYSSLIDPHPISNAFTRRIIHCKRCGSRVVSNVNHCPYCGKNLLPLYRRLWFWIIAVVFIGVAVGALVFLYSPVVVDDDETIDAPPPLAVGTPNAAVVKDLATATTVDCNNLLVTVIQCEQGPTASDGEPLTSVTVQFLNKGSDAVTLYSTQWQLETADGVRVNCFIGKTIDGENISSNLDTRSLPAKDSFTATLYFKAANPGKAVFAPNALSFDETGLVTWKLELPDTTPPADEGTENTQ